ncbi:MAG: hypothetical protein ACEPOZ_12675 [Marinifilaceae bacterium]|jgi:hypothetical protein
MKKIYLLFFIGLFCSLSVEAKKVEVEGRIIFANDTISVKMKIPVTLLTLDLKYDELQYKIKYYDAKGKKCVLKPDGAKEVRFKYKHQEVRMLSRKKIAGVGNLFSANKNIFLRLKIDGPLQLFYFYCKQNYYGAHNNSMNVMFGGFTVDDYKFLIQKKGGELKCPKLFTFRKEMIEYLQDCPDIVRRIKNKEFKKRDLEELVRLYNKEYRKLKSGV